MRNKRQFQNWNTTNNNTSSAQQLNNISNKDLKKFIRNYVKNCKLKKIFSFYFNGMVYYFNETTCVLEQTYTMEQANARKIITPEQMARENLKALIKSNEAENKAALKTKNKKEESKPTKETEGHKESDTKQESKKQLSLYGKKAFCFTGLTV